MADALGVVALVALTPLIAIQLMGILYNYKSSKLQKAAKEPVILPSDSDIIVDLEED